MEPAVNSSSGNKGMAVSIFPGVAVVANLPANAGDTRGSDSISGSGRYPGVGNGNSFSILAWRIQRTEGPGGLHSMGSQSQTLLSTHTLTGWLVKDIMESECPGLGDSLAVGGK